MYVVRWNIRFKWGREADVIKAMKKMNEGQGVKRRIYRAVSGESQMITQEAEYEDVASAAEAVADIMLERIETPVGASEWGEMVTGLTVETLYVETY